MLLMQESGPDQTFSSLNHILRSWTEHQFFFMSNVSVSRQPDVQARAFKSFLMSFDVVCCFFFPEDSYQGSVTRNGPILLGLSQFFCSARPQFQQLEGAQHPESPVSSIPWTAGTHVL